MQDYSTFAEPDFSDTRNSEKEGKKRVNKTLRKISLYHHTPEFIKMFKMEGNFQTQARFQL